MRNAGRHKQTVMLLTLRLASTYSLPAEGLVEPVTKHAAMTASVFDSSTVEGLDWQRVLAWRRQFRAPHRTDRTWIDELRKNWIMAQSFKKFAGNMQRAGVPLTLKSGTLLGWYREGWIIFGDIDIDVMLPRPWFGNRTHSFYSDFRVLFYKRPVPSVKKLRWTQFGVKINFGFFDIDVFVMDEYHDKNKNVTPGCPTGRCAWAFYLPLSPVRVCRPYPHGFRLAVFLGELVWVPWPPLASLLPFYTDDGRSVRELMAPKGKSGLSRGCEQPAAYGAATYRGPIQRAPFRITPGLVPSRARVTELQRLAALRFREHIDAERARSVLQIEAVMALALLLAAEPASRQDWEANTSDNNSPTNVFFAGVWKVYHGCSAGPCTVGLCRALVEGDLLSGGLWLREDMWPFWQPFSMSIPWYGDTYITTLWDWAKQCDWNSVHEDSPEPPSNLFVSVAAALAFVTLAILCIKICAKWRAGSSASKLVVSVCFITLSMSVAWFLEFVSLNVQEKMIQNS